MKRFVFVFTVVLLALAILSVGCGSTAPAAPAAPPAATTVTGILKDINTPTEPGKDVVVVQTPQGQQTFPFAETTKFILEGQACPVGQLGELVDQGYVSYNCTLVVNDEGVLVSVYATPNPTK